MTSLFPHPEYAEDQPYAKTILTFHVLRSGATTGAILSIPSAIASTLYWGPKTLPAFSSRLFIHSFRGSLAGLLFSALALEARMWGKDNIEWQDRSWRLLENKGQVEVDNWILEGEVLGGITALIAARRGWFPPVLNEKMVQTVVGGMGLGSVVGTTDYMVWRYGIRGGKFPDKNKAAGIAQPLREPMK